MLCTLRIRSVDIITSVDKYRILVEKSLQSGQLEDLEGDGKRTFKMGLRELGCERRMWMNLVQDCVVLVGLRMWGLLLEGYLVTTGWFVSSTFI